jgi:hypothetical protein
LRKARDGDVFVLLDPGVVGLSRLLSALRGFAGCSFLTCTFGLERRGICALAGGAWP